MSFSDKEIVVRIITGDRIAFGQVFERYYKGLCAYSYTFLKDHDSAEEIVQDFFAELWENHKKLEIKISLKLYLYRGIHNKCINYLKAFAVSQRRLEKFAQYAQDEIELLEMDIDSNIYEYLFSDSFEKNIHEAINSLAPQQKQIFTLSRFHQKSYADIAGMLNISINSVKTQMARALQKLRTTLIEKLGKYPFILFLLSIRSLSTLPATC